MATLSIDHLAKSYGEKVVLDDIHVEVPSGELVSLLGPSGCGKTTTLNIVAGFIVPDRGRVMLGDREITHVPPYQRDTAVVFQNYALFPHMTVSDNVAYGLHARKVAKEEVVRRVAEALRQVGITELADRYPGQLSGGQQQRVAVARSVVTRPGVLLMDEPLSNLDAKLRADIRLEIRALQATLNQTILFVTHDQEEALSISDRIVVMNGGRVEQMGPPQELFERPRTVFVADFLGVGNILPGQNRSGVWRGPMGMQVTLGSDARATHMGIRPTEVEIHDLGGPQTNDRGVAVDATVLTRTYLGNGVRYQVASDGLTLTAVRPIGEGRHQAGDRISAFLPTSKLLPLDGSGEREPVQVTAGMEALQPKRASRWGRAVRR